MKKFIKLSLLLGAFLLSACDGALPGGGGSNHNNSSTTSSESGGGGGENPDQAIIERGEYPIVNDGFPQ